MNKTIEKKVKSAIDKEMKKLKLMPIVENFGQSSVEKIKDKFNYNDLIYGSCQERNAASLIDLFDNWCMNYTGE